MTRKTLRRSQWRRTKSGTWTCSLGERGLRVRLFQKRKDGTFFRATWRNKKRDVACLHTHDREEAERVGRELLACLLRGEPTVAKPEPLTLGALWKRFHRECASFLDNKPDTRLDAEQRIRVLLGYFGDAFQVEQLTKHHVDLYTAARLAGRIKLADGTMTRRVRRRSVQADFVLLRQMLRWACTVPTVGSGRLLDRNPLDGIRLERERNPRRPLATYDAFLAVRQAVQKLGTDAADVLRERWLRLELALVLAEATGRRRGAIVALRWEDIDFDRGEIHWRAEHEKTGVDAVIPAPPALLAELKAFRVKLGQITGPLFPRRKEPDRLIPAEMLDQWLRAAKAASPDMPSLDREGGFRWHALRRKWATERKHLPLRDVMAAGGWRDMATALRYQQPDDVTLLQVMSSPARLVSRQAAGGETAPETAPRG